MIYTELTKKAIRLSFAAHKDQTDKGGLPYVYHPFHLAEQMQDEATTVAALLHDVAEDTNLTVEDLQKMGIPVAVCDALRLLTHDPQIPCHNSDLSRLDAVTDKDIKRIEKYKAAIALLEN